MSRRFTVTLEDLIDSWPANTANSGESTWVVIGHWRDPDIVEMTLRNHLGAHYSETVASITRDGQEDGLDVYRITWA
jgi:hypothetical protein